MDRTPVAEGEAWTEGLAVRGPQFIAKQKYHSFHSFQAMASMTTISLQRETKERLRKLGSKGQTYDEVIRGLLDLATIRELDDRWNRILADEEFNPLEKV